MFRAIVFFLAMMIASPSSAEIIRIKHSGWFSGITAQDSFEFSGAFSFDTASLRPGPNSSFKLFDATLEYLNIDGANYNTFIYADALKAPYFPQGLYFDHYLGERNKWLTIHLYVDFHDNFTVPSDLSYYDTSAEAWISTGRTIDYRGYTIMSPSFASSVPEPGTWGMMLLGFFTMGLIVRRKRRFVLQHQ